MPTLADVAKRAGVSTATVSRVLSNTPYFTENTKQKVLAAADALGYVPHSAARALASGRTNIVAFVYPYIEEGIADDPAITQILQGVEDEARCHGYHVLMVSPEVNADEEDLRFRNIIASRNIDGSIILPRAVEYEIASIPETHKTPYVTIGYAASDQYVASDGFAGGALLVRHLIELGHKRIGIISAYEHHAYIADRIMGMQAEAEKHGLIFDELPRYQGNFTMPSGSQALEAMLYHHPDLTGIIAVNDRMAIGAIQKARELGYNVPEDLSICGHDNIPLASLFVPSLTTVDHHAAEIGRHSMRMLLDIMQGNKPEAVRLPVTLCVGQSTAAPRKNVEIIS